MGRIDVAVDVGFDQAVHGDDAEAADDFRVVRGFLRAQDDRILETRQVGVQFDQRIRAEREGGGRGAGQLAGLDQLQHAVLQHLGVGRQVLEGAGLQPGHHGIGDVADAGLQRQQVGRQAAHLHLVLQEFQDVAGNALRVLVGRCEG